MAQRQQRFFNSTRLTAAGFAVLLTACAAPSLVRIDQAESGLPSCRTFAWHPIPGDVATLSDQRVKAAVMNTLATKGYEETAEQPDCRIAYQLTTREVPKPKPGVGVGVGGGSRGVGGGVGISIPIGSRPGFTGTFALDVIDAAKNQQVWRGAIDVELESAELTDEDAAALAERVLREYPNAGG